MIFFVLSESWTYRRISATDISSHRVSFSRFLKASVSIRSRTSPSVNTRVSWVSCSFLMAGMSLFWSRSITSLTFRVALSSLSFIFSSWFHITIIGRLL